MRYYPACLDLRERPCLVVGGGLVAERKTLSLIEAGALVTIVSPLLTPQLQELSRSGKITYHAKTFDARDLDSVYLVVVATNSLEVNSLAGRLCRERNILVNVAAPPEESSFIVPSVITRGHLMITVSTNGVSPALSKKIREELEGQYGQEYEMFLDELASVRKKLLDEVPDETVRRGILKAIVDSDAIDLMKKGSTVEAKQRVEELLRQRRG